MALPHIKPSITVDGLGQINWTSPTIDHAAELFYRGKTVTNDEFNKLFIKQTAQANYTTESLNVFLNTLFPEAVYRQVKSRFDFASSYIRLFGSSDWTGPDAEGYYYITITAAEHGISPELFEGNTPISVDAEMYVYENDTAYRVEQIKVDNENTIQLYTDDPALFGYVLVRINRKAYTVGTQGKIDASHIIGLQRVALTADYNDLINIPDLSKLDDILNGSIRVPAALNATHAEDVLYLLKDTLFAGVPIGNILEEGTAYVKNARYADFAGSADYADVASDAYIAESAAYADHAIYSEYANSADLASRAGYADSAYYAAGGEDKGLLEDRLTRIENKLGIIY